MMFYYDDDGINVDLHVLMAVFLHIWVYMYVYACMQWM